MNNSEEKEREPSLVQQAAGSDPGFDLQNAASVAQTAVAVAQAAGMTSTAAPAVVDAARMVERASAVSSPSGGLGRLGGATDLVLSASARDTVGVGLGVAELADVAPEKTAAARQIAALAPLADSATRSAAAEPATTPATAIAAANANSMPAGPAAPDLDSQPSVFDLLSAIAQTDFDDERRLFAVHTILPADKRLFLDTLQGVEALNEPFEFKLRLASRNASIELKELISTPVTVRIRQNDGSARYLNGVIKAFAFEVSDGGWAFYRATMVPWTHFMSLRRDSRIFQKKSVPDIVDAVFKEYGAVADFEFRLTRGYAPIDFVVQYQESDYNFVHRLMEREGWTCYFEQRVDGHRLIVTDDTMQESNCPPLPLYDSIEFNGGKRVASSHCVDDLQAGRELQPGKVTLDTYDYQSPRGVRMVEVPTLADQGRAPRLEVFDGTPGFAFKDRAEGERYAKLRMETFEARAKYFAGGGDCPDFTVGRTVAVTGHFWFNPLNPDADRLLLTRVEHQGRNNIKPGDEAHYRNQFQCQRRKVPFRPQPRHAKPTIPGLQTATVTGPAGHEVWTNENGCVKVRFHWDRRAAFDERSSCWIRVSQPTAGQGWGSVTIPRVGQEVIVGFMEGDPDRPMVLGSVYNADQKLPYAMPAGAHMMGFKSSSTPGGGGFCEMVIHDEAGKELINIHSQKDMVTTVQNEQATVVNGPKQTIAVTRGFQQTTVKQHIHIESLEDEITLKAPKKILFDVTDGPQETRAKQYVKIESLEDEIEIVSAKKISLRCGASTIVMDQAGTIEIRGKHVIVNGSDRVDLNE